VSVRVLGDQSDGVLAAHSHNLVRHRITHRLVDLSQLLLALCLIEAVDEEVNIRGRVRLLMIILSPLLVPLGVLLWEGTKGC